MYTSCSWIISVGARVASLLPAAQGSEWRQFRGPDRNGVSKETGLRECIESAAPRGVSTLLGAGEFVAV